MELTAVDADDDDVSAAAVAVWLAVSLGHEEDDAIESNWP